MLNKMQTDPWDFLQTYTAARIARGRAGHSLPTRALLDFQLDHARARDAVYSTLETGRLLADIDRIKPRPLLLQSQATDRRTYLQRPDQGRRLDADSWLRLKTLSTRPADLS
ncbi:MAG: ethanolamine ammonia-lyase, partial [Cytophagaceae bacterium]